MNQLIEVTITAEVPDGSHDLGHEAIVAAKEPAQALVTKLTELGLTNIKQTRRMIKRKAAKADTAPMPVDTATTEETAV
jgi:hypothetical protein